MPKNPAVVTPVESVGTYGGTLRRGQTSPDDWAYQFLTRASLLEWSLDQTFTPTPALCESFDMSPDATTYTFHLREGLKWSDGHPFTADDLVFWYEDVALNKELSPSFPAWISVGQDPVAVTKSDDLTVIFTYPRPQALLPRLLAYYGFTLLTPKHYLSQFHPNYVAKADLDAAMDAAGVGSWPELFQIKNTIRTNPDCPVVGAWQVTTPMTGGATRMVAERNPYYWKVDTAGNQLPYIDQLTFDVLDQTALVLRAANGEIDLQARYIGFPDVTVLQESAEEKGFEILQWPDGEPWTAGLYTNQSHGDPVVRELMQALDFRAALSHAINRDEVNQLLYLGLGTIAQPCGTPEDSYFQEGFGQRYLAYDTAKVNELLDKVGLSERSSDGTRLRSDGKELTLSILSFGGEGGAVSNDVYELVVGYWKAVGIKAALNIVDNTLWSERMHAGDFDIGGYSITGPLWDLEAVIYLPISPSTYWCPKFGTYYETGGEGGEAPPENIAQLVTYYEEMQGAQNDEARVAAGRKVLAAHDENMWMIGTVKTPFFPVIKNKKLGNVMTVAVEAFVTQHEEVTQFEQLYYREA